MKPVRKNSQVAKQIFDNVKECYVSNLSNCFVKELVPNENLPNLKNHLDKVGYRIYEMTDGSYQIDVHSNLWYKIVK